MDGEYDLKVPRDMAYVFSGAYVPLSCRIIEQVGAATPAPVLTSPWPVLPGSSQLIPALSCLKPAGKGLPGCPCGLENRVWVPQVLERRSWQGLEEVVRLLNCSECAFTGVWCGEGWASPGPCASKVLR